MSIGGALAEARSEAGLSITDVSERTRIRAAIIRDIERDDYAACGGDFYARGHIRAIAKVVGADPVPLIAEYDAARMPPADPDGLADGLAASAGAVSGAVDPLAAGRPERERHGETMPVRSAGDVVEAEILTRAAVRRRLAESGQAAGARVSASARGAVAWLAQSAQAGAGWLTVRSERIGRTKRGGLGRLSPGAEQRPRWIAVLVLALLAAIGLLIYLLISGSAADTGVPKAHSGAHPDRHRRPAPARHGGHTIVPGTAGTGQPPAVLLTPASIEAFGPGGPGQSDDPRAASLAIDDSSRTAWHTSWYTTPDFGRLQSGTGLLLDMVQPVAVTSARVLFGPAPGGAFQLRAGNSPALSSLLPVAQAANPGGAVTVRISRPVRARYLLVWITRLPPDNTGTYQALIYDITVRGAR